MANRFIDVHHHYFPKSLNKAAASSAVGFCTPPEHLPWTPAVSLNAMAGLGIDSAVLSVPANFYPPPLAARQVNGEMAAVCNSHPGRFAFWACLGDWRDVDSALELISYCMDELHAVGVAVASCYGSGPDAKYIGNDAFDPIWAELNRRHALVFVHGAQTPSSTPMPHPLLGLPITEAPHETFKAASHLLVAGTTRRFPHLAFILAHLGGSALPLAHRVAALSTYMAGVLAPESAEPLAEDAVLCEMKKFYLDSALSGGPALAVARAMGVLGRVVWGSDFPAVPVRTIRWFEEQQAVELGAEEREGVKSAIARLIDERGLTTSAFRLDKVFAKL